MKKNGLVRLLALTSCVAILAGCGKEDPKIYVKDLPETFHLGETIDLDKYVTVKGTSKSFKVYVYKASEELVSVKDHKITLKEEGEITFSLYIGKVEQVVKVQSIAEMREALIKAFAGYDGEYLAFGMNTGDTFIHREEYGVRTRFDRKNLCDIRNGYVSGASSDAGYEFYSDAEGYYYGSPKIISKSSFESLNHFNVDIKGAKRDSIKLSSGDTEVYTLTSSALKNFASSVMLTDASKYTLSVQTGTVSEEDPTPVYGDVTTSISRVDFTYLDVSGVKYPSALVYGKLNNQTQLIDALVFTNDPNNLEDDAYGEYFANNPNDLIFVDSPVYNLTSLFTNDISASRQLIAEFNYGWFDKEGERIEEPDDVPGTYFEGLPVGSVTRVFSEDAIVDVVDEKIVSGSVQHTEDEVTTVYDVKLVSEIVEGNEVSHHDHEANPDYEELYDNPYASLAHIVDEKNMAFDSFYVSKTENIGTQEEPVTKYTLLPNLTRHYDFLDGIFTCEDGVAPLASFFFKYKDKQFQEYFNFSLTIVPSQLAVHMEASLMWDRQGNQNYKIIFDLHYDSTQKYAPLVSALFTELFGS